jgi:uncharacterized protein YjbI with pentapeptide repeats
MNDNYIFEQKFEEIDYTENNLEFGEYEKCQFNNCDFSNSDISGFTFIDCAFNSCNLALTKLNHTSLRDVNFKDCKMIGLRFESCNNFGISIGFENCILNHSSFFKVILKKTIFRNSKFENVDFSDSDLSNSIFDACDLTRATFAGTNLEKADLRTSYNYTFNPEINKIKKAKFSIYGLAGLLDKYNIIIDNK